MSYLSRRMREDGWPRKKPATGGVVSGMSVALDESGPPAFVWPPPGVVGGIWVDEVTHYFASTTPEPLPDLTLADIVRAYHELEGMPKVPEKIKLTTGEWDAVREGLPEQPPSRPWAPLSIDLAGVPVELVDDPEDSDLRRWWSR